MILQKKAPKELLRKGYWFRASADNTYIVELHEKYSKIDGELVSVTAKVYEPDRNEIDFDINTYNIKKGTEVYYTDLIWNNYERKSEEYVRKT